MRRTRVLAMALLLHGTALLGPLPASAVAPAMPGETAPWPWAVRLAESRWDEGGPTADAMALPWNPLRPAGDATGAPEGAWMRVAPPAPMAAGPVRGALWGFATAAFNLGMEDFEGHAVVSVPQLGWSGAIPARLPSLYSERPNTWFLLVRSPLPVPADAPADLDIEVAFVDAGGRPAGEPSGSRFRVYDSQAALPCQDAPALLHAASVDRVTWPWDLPLLTFSACNRSPRGWALAWQAADRRTGAPLEHLHPQILDVPAAWLGPGEDLAVLWVLAPRVPLDIDPEVQLIRDDGSEERRPAGTIAFSGLASPRGPGAPDAGDLAVPLAAPSGAAWWPRPGGGPGGARSPRAIG